MFSGIIENTTKANKIEKNKDSIRLHLPIPKTWKVTVGESINIDGVCSTVEKLSKDEFTVYYMPETLRITKLSSVTKDHIFNLEQCLTLQTLIGGHLVSGHIDTTAKLDSIKNEGESKTLTFKMKTRGPHLNPPMVSLQSPHLTKKSTALSSIPELLPQVLNSNITVSRAFTKYIIYKGSIAVNGVSLTIVTVDQDSFSVSLIPHTLTHTNLGNLKKGDLVNIELDLIAKYLEKLAH